MRNNATQHAGMNDSIWTTVADIGNIGVSTLLLQQNTIFVLHLKKKKKICLIGKRLEEKGKKLKHFKKAIKIIKIKPEDHP